MELNTFGKAYVECLLWAENDNSSPQGGDPLDQNYGWEDLTPLAKMQVWRDCRNFQEAAEGLIPEGMEAQAGHDFWLTRNGHGAGFWDRPEVYGKQAADTLTRMAKACGGLNPLVGDDGQISLELP
jgi:hypothetical protein